MELIGDGAEAALYVDDGTVVKERHAKRYRHPELDERLREERTSEEARLLRKAGMAGVAVPAVLNEGSVELDMELVEGDVLRDVFVARRDMWPRIGRDIAKLHRGGVVHGDLTTSNIIVHDEEPVFIDFGLGFLSDRVEDRATDLHLLRQVLHSSHTDVAEEAMDAILDGYTAEADDGEAVVERMRAVAKRGRYK